MSTTRADVVEDLLIHHRMSRHGTGDLRCACGHRYRLGESIRRHRADLIVAALDLESAGVPPERIPRAALGVLDLAGLLRT